AFPENAAQPRHPCPAPMWRAHRRVPGCRIAGRTTGAYSARHGAGLPRRWRWTGTGIPAASHGRPANSRPGAGRYLAPGWPRRRPARTAVAPHGENGRSASRLAAGQPAPESAQDQRHWRATPRLPGASAPHRRSDLASLFLVFLVKRGAVILVSFRGDTQERQALRQAERLAALSWPLVARPMYPGAGTINL